MGVKDVGQYETHVHEYLHYIPSLRWSDEPDKPDELDKNKEYERDHFIM